MNMSMNNINKDELKIRDRARVEAGTANTLKDHGFSKAHGEVFVAIAYDTFHEVKNSVPANAQVLTDFLLKEQHGRDMMKEAKAIIASNRMPAPIPVLDVSAIAPVAVEREFPALVAPVMKHALPKDIFKRLTARVHEAFDDYRTHRDRRYIDSVLVEIANACTVHSVTEFQMPWKDYTEMSKRFYFQRLDAVNSGKIEDWLTLVWQPGDVPSPRKAKVQPSTTPAE